MKRLAIIALLGTLAAPAAANFQCGIKPIPPIGCAGKPAQCICDDYGCRWVWVGCGQL